jgi:hypothetical protein
MSATLHGSRSAKQPLAAAPNFASTVDWRDWSGRHDKGSNATDRDVFVPIVRVVPTVHPIQEPGGSNSTTTDVVREVYIVLNNAARRCVDDAVPCQSRLDLDISQSVGESPPTLAEPEPEANEIEPLHLGTSADNEAAILTPTLNAHSSKSEPMWDSLLGASGHVSVGYEEFEYAVRKAPLAVPASELPDRTLRRFVDVLTRGKRRSIQTKRISEILNQPSAEAACALLLTNRLPAPAQQPPAIPCASDKQLQLGFFWKERHPDVFPPSWTHR